MYNLFITINLKHTSQIFTTCPNEDKQVIDFKIQIQATNLLLVQKIIFFIYF